MAKDLEFFKTLLNGLTNKIDSDRTWDKLKNKPFYEETKTVNEPLSITWDGNTEGLVRVGEEFFKVSDVVLTDDQIKTSTIFANVGFSFSVIDVWDSMVEAGMVTEDVVAVGEGYAIFVRRPGSEIGPFVFPEAGIYFVKINDEVHISGLTTTAPVEQTKVVTKKIDPKYLPDVGGMKYVYVNEEYDGDAETWIQTADTPYAKIRNWVDSGMEVKCIFGTGIYNLIYAYPEMNVVMHGTMLKSVTFASSDTHVINEITVYSDDTVEYKSYELSLAPYVINVVDNGGVLVANYTYNEIFNAVHYEGRPIVLVHIPTGIKMHLVGNPGQSMYYTFSAVESFATGGRFGDIVLHRIILGPDTKSGNVGLSPMVAEYSAVLLPATQDVQDMINESLGVIENGTY